MVHAPSQLLGKIAPKENYKFSWLKMDFVHNTASGFLWWREDIIRKGRRSPLVTKIRCYFRAFLAINIHKTLIETLICQKLLHIEKLAKQKKFIFFAFKTKDIETVFFLKLN